MVTAAFIAAAVLALTLSIALSRTAGRACYRINRDAYHRAQHAWRAERRRDQLIRERSTRQ